MTELWAGEFGDDYTCRNAEPGHRDLRAALWDSLLPPNCRSVLEVGANVGVNVEIIRSLGDYELYACEPNDLARVGLEILLPHDHVTADYADKLSFPDGVADLVFTCGVLIHVEPVMLLASMKEIYRCAKQWIICAEYFAPSEEMIPYRGRMHAMWRRDYGSLWLDSFPDLHCHGCTFAWKRMTGLDNLTFWVFEKGRRRH